MNTGDHHEAYISSEFDTPVVAFSNDNDPYYTEYFHNWAQVRKMVDQILATAEEAWGKEP